MRRADCVKRRAGITCLHVLLCAIDQPLFTPTLKTHSPLNQKLAIVPFSARAAVPHAALLLSLKRSGSVARRCGGVFPCCAHEELSRRSCARKSTKQGCASLLLLLLLLLCSGIAVLLLREELVVERELRRFERVGVHEHERCAGGERRDAHNERALSFLSCEWRCLLGEEEGETGRCSCVGARRGQRPIQQSKLHSILNEGFAHVRRRACAHKCANRFTNQKKGGKGKKMHL